MMAELIRCSCTRVNDPWRRYCGGCGKQLQPSCGCGFVNAKSDRFCGGCGSRLAQPHPREEPTTIPLDIIEVVS